MAELARRWALRCEQDGVPLPPIDRITASAPYFHLGRDGLLLSMAQKHDGIRLVAAYWGDLVLAGGAAGAEVS